MLPVTPMFLQHRPQHEAVYKLSKNSLAQLYTPSSQPLGNMYSYVLHSMLFVSSLGYSH